MGRVTWKASDPDLPRTSSSQIGIRRLTTSLILRTVPEPFKMLKTGQRARYSTGRDPDHLLSSEICRELRDSREEMLRLRDLGTNTPTGVPYIKDQIMAMGHQGKQQGHIPGVGMVLAGHGRGVVTPRPVWGCDRLVSRAKVIKNQVMAALVISISSDVPVTSVGSSFPRVIYIGSISIEVSIAPEVEVAAVSSLARVLELDTHSSSKADPSESSLPPVSVAPMVSPFLCSDNSESDTKIPERHVSPAPHDAMLTRWRSRVALRSSSLTTSTSEIPTALILPHHLLLALTMRKSVRPLPSHHLALRYTSHHLDRFTSGSSSSHSSLDHSSSGHSISGHSLSGHTSPDTTIVDSSTPLRFVHPLLARTPRCNEAYLHWRSALLSTMYLPMTFELSTGDSSSKALVPSRADLLPPRKRFRDSISLKDSVEEDIDTDILEDIKADATTVKVVVDRDVVTWVDAGIDMEVDVRVNVEDEVEDEVKSNDRGTMEVGVDVADGIDIPDAMLMPDAVERLEQVEEGCDENRLKQVHLDALLAKRLAEEEELTEQQKKRKVQVQFEAQFYIEEDWDAIRAKLEANAELTKDVLGKDLSEQDFVKRMVDLVNQRKKHFAEERAKAKRNKPMTQSHYKGTVEKIWRIASDRNFQETKD
ncbi:hypothetical protein Tco_0950789 [Tanacetum coccineum]